MNEITALTTKKNVAFLALRYCQVKKSSSMCCFFINKCNVRFEIYCQNFPGKLELILGPNYLLRIAITINFLSSSILCIILFFKLFVATKKY